MERHKGLNKIELASLEEYIEKTLDDQRVVGASVGIVHDQELIWAKGFGYSDVKNRVRPDGRTLYRIDSNTKPFTGLAIMQLRDAGLLDLNQSLASFIPEIELAEIRYGSLKDITLRRLLTHRSGIVGEAPGNWAETGIGPTADEILSRLSEVGVVIPPDSQHKYSNLAFMLLGQVVERLSGNLYSEYIEQNIFRPLGLTGSTFDPDESQFPRAVQYFGPSSNQEAIPIRLIHNGRRPAGGIFSNIEDMAKWISLQFRTVGSDSTKPGVLSAATIEEMHQVQYMEPDWQSGQCLPWRAVRNGEHVYLGHGGGNAGSLSQTYFHKPTKIGVIVLTNSDAHTAHQGIAIQSMSQSVKAFQSVSAALSNKEPIQGPPPAKLESLIGEYAGNRPNTGVQIAWVEESLTVLPLGEDVPNRIVTSSGVTYPAHLEPTADPLVFTIKEGRMAGETLKFITGDEEHPPWILLQTGAIFRKAKAKK